MLLDPQPCGLVHLAHSTIEWEPGAVVCRFAAGVQTRSDWGSLLRDQREWYEGVVRTCGYDDRVAAYALHHDFCHLWLPERLWGVPSPTLEAVANGWPPPPINRSEEYLVNTVQWALATGNLEYRAEYLRQIVGEDWIQVLADLADALDALARPL